MNNKVALVTGASSGIGYETAIALKAEGFIVYGAARRMDKLEVLKASGVEIISLDVTSEASMEACVHAILEKEKRIDVLVNNAGYGSHGAIEDVSIEEAKRQMEVNVFGLARMCQLVLPTMRKNHYGRIINISSMGGKMHSSFGGWYHATKFAVEALSDCMRMEVKPFGIDVVVVEPGGIKTEWGTIAADHLKASSSKGAYAKKASVAADRIKKLYTGKHLTDPAVIAGAIVKASTARRPKTRYLLGYGAKISIFLRRILSDRMFDRVIEIAGI